MYTVKFRSQENKYPPLPSSEGNTLLPLDTSQFGLLFIE